jgi:hypothetical protein
MTRRSDVTDIAHRYLEGARKRYEQRGDKGVILRCVHRCLSWDVPLPEWLWTAFDAAYQKARFFEIDSWDDVFGTIVPKRTQRKAAERRRKLAGQVYAFVQQRHASGHPMDREMFEIAAKEVGLPRRRGKRGGLSDPSSTAMDYYYKQKAIADFFKFKENPKKNPRKF